MSKNDNRPTGTGELSPVSLWKCTLALMVDLPIFNTNIHQFYKALETIPNFTINTNNCHIYQILEDMPEFTSTELDTIYRFYGKYEPNYKYIDDSLEVLWVDYESELIKFRKFSRLN